MCVNSLYAYRRGSVKQTGDVAALLVSAIGMK